MRLAASQFSQVAGGGGPAGEGGGGGAGGGSGEGGGGGGSSGGGGDGGGGGQSPQLSGQARSTSSHAVVQKLVAARAAHCDVGISSLPRSRQSPSSVKRGHESSARGVVPAVGSGLGVGVGLGLPNSNPNLTLTLT